MSSLQDRLYNYEQIPPGKVWEKIAAALDDSHIADEFPSKLHEAEIAPPSGAWEKITNSLDAEHSVVMPMSRKSFSLLRYAAAAVITGLITFGVIKWAGSNNHPGDQDIVVSKNSDSSSKKEMIDRGENKTANAVKDQETIVPPADKNLIAKIEQVKTTPVKKTRKKYFVADHDFDTEPIYAYNEHSPANLADRYIMLMTPNGIIRMSKKLGGLVCCVSGQEQDEDCKDQLKKWQEKIACSPVAPSPGNFMDILSLVSSLNDKSL